MPEPINGAIGLPQDLKNVYIYWDFSPQRLWVLRDFMTHVKPGMEFCLRLLSFTASSSIILSVEREVLFETIGEYGGFYFRNVNQFLNYQFELGGKEPDGNFVPFARTALLELQAAHREPSSFIRIPLSLTDEWKGFKENQPSSSSFTERSSHIE